MGLQGQNLPEIKIQLDSKESIRAEEVRRSPSGLRKEGGFLGKETKRMHLALR